MKHYCTFLIFALILLFQINSKMTEEQRQYLLNKLTKKVSIEDGDEIKALKEKFYSRPLKDTIKYDTAKIEEILTKYGFPQEFNYLEENNITAIVKDQAYCGCCWSHSATTALGYRYHKLGIDVNLSPQDALSCYLRDCDMGNYLIDTQMNLVKNGTLTEGCLPFSSGDGITIEDCPTKCKDGSEFKRYYSQNAYITEDYISKDTFYEVVALIMDQLINKGPVVTGIDVYEDFMTWHYDPVKCHDEVYSYDGVSENLGGHAIAIVGYGILNSKYYWLIQNSWGEWACDKGFVKVEFGNIGVEAVGFSEPYIHKDIIYPTNISIKYDSLDEECTLQVTTTASLDSWQNTLDIGFKNNQTNKPFNFQCSSVDLVQGKTNKCYFEYYNFFADKGTYKYSYFGSLGDENTFSLDTTLKSKEFYYYGLDEIYPIYSEYLYISQEGSKILFIYYGDEENIDIPPIYANEDSDVALSDCNYLYLGGQSFVACNIKEFELSYFNNKYNYMCYDVLCGYKEPNYAIASILDTTSYPIFKIKNFILPDKKSLGKDSILTLVADVEGSLTSYKAAESYFVALIEIEVEGQNFTSLIDCTLDHPGKIRKNYMFNCYLQVESEDEIPYDNIYLHPYNLPYDNGNYPYEVYIKEMIKGQFQNLNIPKIQIYIESLCHNCVDFFKTSFKNFYEKVQNPNLVDIEFIPYGNAKEVYNEATGKYEFECHHKENECYGNLIQTCAIQVMGRIKSYETILCIEINSNDFDKDFDKTLAYCLSNDQTTLEEIKTCVASDMGNYYQHQMAQKTGDHQWVPWVIVNGVHDVDVENQILHNLIDYICGDDKSKCY